MTPPYHSLVAHYERCLEEHGDTHRGVDWPDATDARTRYEVMLDVIREPDPVRLLDFGCGAAHLLEHIRDRGRTGIEYVGLDLSPRFVELSRAKFPDHEFLCTDVLAEPAATLPPFDYAILNGVFTERLDLEWETMFAFMAAVVGRTFAAAGRGIAFNVMSPRVDWERDDLFHVGLDRLTGHLAAEVTRDFVVRHDYGLYEYTVYAYR